MLANTEINPKNSLYYIGGIVIAIMRNHNKKIDFFELYNLVNDKRPISVKLFILSLDWLFLIEAIEIKNNNQLRLCI